MNEELKTAINTFMPEIDEALAELNIPIHKRFILAGKFFVELAVVDSTFDSNEELIKSEAFRAVLLPLINDWYWDKYGELAKGPGGDVYSGIVLAYGEPVHIRIPATTSKIEVEGKSAWLTFPDYLQESENIEDLIQTKIHLDKMSKAELKAFQKDVRETVALTRSINLDMNTVTGLEKQADNLVKGIWSHFEKAIGDILTLKVERASIACWDIHLAVEKSLKVLINSKTQKIEHGHNLMELADVIQSSVPELNLSFLKDLPSEKDAIKLRYAEITKTPTEVIGYYKLALRIVAGISVNLDHKYGFKNASILLNAAPWAR